MGGFCDYPIEKGENGEYNNCIDLVVKEKYINILLLGLATNGYVILAY